LRISGVKRLRKSAGRLLVEAMIDLAGID